MGSLRLVVDSSGNVIKMIDYDSFGNIINDTNPGFAVPFSFAGGLHDRDTGLIRFGYRDYDPDIGRWTAKDPIGFEAGDVNFYSYVQNNPGNSVDPSGLFVARSWIAVFLGLGGISFAAAGQPVIGGILVGAAVGLYIWESIEAPREAEEYAKRKLEPAEKELKELEKALNLDKEEKKTSGGPCK